METDGALTFIRECGRRGRFLFTQASEQKLRERGLTFRDVRQVLARAEACTRHKNGNWKVKGTDLDGAEQSLIVTIAGRAIVVL